MKTTLIKLVSLLFVLTVIFTLGSQKAYAAELETVAVFFTDAADETAECAHDYVGKITRTATCKRTGVKTFTCKKCGDSYTESIARRSHTYRSYRVLRAGCTSTGCYWKICSGCSHSYWQMTKATGHTYSEKVIKKATCKTTGTKRLTCVYCGRSKTATIPVSRHTYKQSVEQPTCTSSGFTVYRCSVCNYQFTSNKRSALGHVYNETIIREPTRCRTGEKCLTCERCGDTYFEEIEVENKHSYVLASISDSTCKEDGIKYYACEFCGDGYTEAIPATGHSYTVEVIEPTCVSGGYTKHVCSGCGDSYTDNETASTGHNYAEEVTKQSTCTEEGVKTLSCTSCGDSYTESIAETGHDYGTAEVAPTCENGGYTVHTCANCGDSYTDNETAAIGHAYEDTVVAPSCTSGGYTSHVCTNCGNSYADSETSAVGHSWSEWVITKEADEDVEGSQERVCSTCGEKEIEVIPEIHYHNFVVTSQTVATCTENGVIYRACSCGETNYSTVEEALGHKWVKHHEDGVGHYETYIVCHCGWRFNVADGDYITAFAEHSSVQEEWWEHSYYDTSEWIEESPAKDWYECSACGETK